VRIILAGCVETKALPETDGYPKPTLPAKDLYVSPLFQKRRAYAEREVAEGRAEAWAILSALFKCVPPERELPGYDWTMSSWRGGELAQWGRQVPISLYRDVLNCEHSLEGAVVEIHAGASYVDLAKPYLKAYGCVVETPLKGLQIGEQLHWYNAELDPQLALDEEAA
jgi:hypothetical protein